MQVCLFLVGRTTKLTLFPERNRAPRYLPTSRLRAYLGSGPAGPPHREAALASTSLTLQVASKPQTGGGSRSAGQHREGRGIATGTGPQRGAVATLVHSPRWLPRNSRTLSAVLERRAATEWVVTRLGSEREGRAVQQPVQPAALRGVTPLACASVAPLLARGLTWRSAHLK